MKQQGTTVGHEGRWARRPVVAFGLRALATAVPLLVSIAVVFAASRRVDRPVTLGPQVAWWAGLLALGTASLVLADRFARRLLPLAALLRLSIVFPDAAPSRFSVALRAGTVPKLTRASSGPSPADDTATAEQTPAARATAELARLIGELHTHDRRTRGHAERVRAYTQMIATELGIAGADRTKLEWAALLHDVGKLAVPSAILNKPGRLDEGELAVIRGHPAAGAELVEPLRWWLGPWADAVGQHHERVDGQGYPARLAGAEISLGGRIVAVADAFDVMTAARSYKKPQDAVAARAELTRCAGSHFDPVVVRAFLSLSIARVRATMGPLSWLANIPVLGSAASAPVAGSAIGAAAATALGAGIVALPPRAPERAPTATTVAATAPLPPAASTTTSRDVGAVVSAWGTDWSGGTNGPTVSAPTTTVPPTSAPLAPAPTTSASPPEMVPVTVAPTTGAPTTAAPPSAPVTEPPAPPATPPPTTSPSAAPPTTPPAAVTQPGGPLAVDDVATVGSHGFVNIRVVRNDVDGVGGGLRVMTVSPGQLGGEVSDNGNGTLRYVPVTPAGTIDRFTYVIADALGRTATATVSVSIL